MPESRRTAPTEPPSLLREFAMALTPLALPKPYSVPATASAELRRETSAANQRHLHRYMALYIARSARVLLGAFLAFQLTATFFPHPLLVASLGVLVLAVLLHLAAVIFWKQHLDNRYGLMPPREER